MIRICHSGSDYASEETHPINYSESMVQIPIISINIWLWAQHFANLDKVILPLHMPLGTVPVPSLVHPVKEYRGKNAENIIFFFLI